MPARTLKTRVFLDTNFFMIPYKHGIDIFQEITRLLSCDAGYELATLASVKRELGGIVEKARGRDRIAAQVGLQLIESKGITVLEGSGGVVDAQLVSMAEKDRNMIVCTNDRPLKNALRERKIPVITMRSRSHLEYA